MKDYMASDGTQNVEQAIKTTSARALKGTQPVDHYIAVSRAEVTQYLRMGISPDDVTVIYNGIDLDEFESLPEPGSVRQ